MARAASLHATTPVASKGALTSSTKTTTIVSNGAISKGRMDSESSINLITSSLGTSLDTVELASERRPNAPTKLQTRGSVRSGVCNSGSSPQPPRLPQGSAAEIPAWARSLNSITTRTLNSCFVPNRVTSIAHDSFQQIDDLDSETICGAGGVDSRSPDSSAVRRSRGVCLLLGLTSDQRSEKIFEICVRLCSVFFLRERDRAGYIFILAPLSESSLCSPSGFKSGSACRAFVSAQRRSPRRSAG